MTTKIDGPAAEVDPSAAELARANERHTKVNAADAAKLDRIADDAGRSFDAKVIKAAENHETVLLADQLIAEARSGLMELLIDASSGPNLKRAIKLGIDYADGHHARGMALAWSLSEEMNKRMGVDRVLAAAPVMLAALKAAEEYLVDSGHPDYDPETCECFEGHGYCGGHTLKEVRAAIAKAEGGAL